MVLNFAMVSDVTTRVTGIVSAPAASRGVRVLGNFTVLWEIEQVAEIGRNWVISTSSLWLLMLLWPEGESMLYFASAPGLSNGVAPL